MAVADNSSDASPQGMAVRFRVDRGTDIVANSHNGFVVGTGEHFLAQLKTKVAPDPSKPHPLPIQTFLQAHRRAMRQYTQSTPASFTTEAFYGNNAFLFVDAADQSRPGRYQMVPAAGVQYLDDVAAKATSPNFLIGDLKAHLAEAPRNWRLIPRD